MIREFSGIALLASAATFPVFAAETEWTGRWVASAETCQDGDYDMRIDRSRSPRTRGRKSSSGRSFAEGHRGQIPE